MAQLSLSRPCQTFLSLGVGALAGGPVAAGPRQAGVRRCLLRRSVQENRDHQFHQEHDAGDAKGDLRSALALPVQDLEASLVVRDLRAQRGPVDGRHVTPRPPPP